MNKLQIMICDDVARVCDGYKMFVNLEPDMECAITAYDTVSCLERVGKYKPDILLLDIQMEDEKSGIQIIPEIKKLSPKTVIVMLTSYNNSKYIFHSVMNGADGYVIKDANGKNVLAEVRNVYNRVKHDENSEVDVMEALKNETKSLYKFQKSILFIMDTMVRLSNTEYQILKDIYNGVSYRKIAEKRVVEECSVRTSASRIIRKFGAKSMRELVKELRDIHIFDVLD